MIPDTQYIEKYVLDNGGDLSHPLDVPLHCTIKINPIDFKNYALKNQNQVTKKYIRPRPFLNADSNLQATHVNWIGYNEQNSTEYNWGVRPEENEDLKKIVGLENFNILGIDPDIVSVRLLWYNPGHMLPIHYDGKEGFIRLTGRDPDVRFVVAVEDWDWGHFVQIHDKMLTNWKAGDTYIVPPKIFHLSGNAGIRPKLTLTITGVWK